MTKVSFTRGSVQARILTDEARFRVVVAGRRSGKTWLNVGVAGMEALRGPLRRVWYVTPDWKQVAEFWNPLLASLPRRAVRRVNASTMLIELANGSTIQCRNATHQDRLRGAGLDFVILDEYQDVHAHLFDAVVRPALADRRGGALFSGTPKGRGSHFHSLYEIGQRGESGFRSWLFTAADTGTVHADEMEEARRAAERAGPTSHKLWRREWLADWSAFVGQVFEVWDESTMVTRDEPARRVRTVMGQDWGFTESHAGVLEVAAQAPDGTWTLVDEIAAIGKTTEGWWVPRIADAAKRWRADVVYCDPARPDAIAALRRAAPELYVREANNAVLDGVIHMATLMETGKFRVHERCRLFREEVVGYRWEEARDGTVRERPVKARDNAIDASRYALFSESKFGQVSVA
jgi:hypothetical protein